MGHEVIFCVWNINNDEELLVEKIEQAFLDLAPPGTTVKISDVNVYEVDLTDQIIVIFGHSAWGEVHDQPYKEGWLAPSIDKILLGDLEDRKKTLNILREAADYLKNLSSAAEQEQYIQTPEGITIGSSMCDINITKEEAEHLKTIKDILGGGKIIITKGDLKIEVE